MRVGMFLFNDEFFGLIRLGFCSNPGSISSVVYKVTVFNSWSLNYFPLPIQSKEHRRKEKYDKRLLFLHSSTWKNHVCPVSWIITSPWSIYLWNTQLILVTQYGRMGKRWLWLGQSWRVGCKSSFWKDRYVIQFSLIFPTRLSPTCLCLAGLCFVASFPKGCSSWK